MRDKFLLFCKPSITEREIGAVVDVLKSGWITTGPNTEAFEQRFRETVGCEHAVAVCSATGGMHILLSAMELKPGDEVITPSMTWVSTVNLITLAGATPVFADIDRDTLMVTPESVRARITPRTRLIIPVHFAGAAADLDGLRAVAAEHGVPLIEDAAHAAGTTYRDRPIGRDGTAVFSFHPIKNMTTGEGGMICTGDAELAARMRRLRFHGLGVDAYDRQTHGRAPQAEVIEPGYKYNLTDIAAALGLVQLERLAELNARRAALAALYLEKLAAIDEVAPLGQPAYPIRHAWHLFIVRLDIDRAGMDRDAFMRELKARNIGTGLHFRAVHRQKFYRENPATAQTELPNTDYNSDRICSLPLFPDMVPENIDVVVDAIKDVLAHD